MSKKGILISWLIVAALAFGGGYVLQYSALQQLRARNDSLQAEVQKHQELLQECRFQRQLGRLRDLAGQMYLQAARNDFSVAAQYSTRFFNLLRRSAEEASDPSLRRALEELLEERDALTSQLARADAAARESIQNLYSRLWQVSGAERLEEDRE